MIKELWKKYKNYVISILIALLTGGISALLTMKNMDLFDIVEKPPLSPPAILFPIVWSILRRMTNSVFCLWVNETPIRSIWQGSAAV